MKGIITILFFVIGTAAYAQQPYVYYFEPPYNAQTGEFVLDSSNHIGSWQIGRPYKTVFKSAKSAPNAIVTDTLNSYPINDTSVFVFKVDNYYYSQTPVGPKWYIFAGIQFDYKLDIDSGEIVKVELATDSGNHWVDLLKEDTTYGIGWSGDKPDFTKSTTDWKRFAAYFHQWAFASQGNDNSKYPHIFNTDSTYIRFTFISDSVQTNKDGWMIDNLYLGQYSTNIETIANNNLISIYPNPAKDYIYIKANYNYYAQAEATIYNLQGQEVYSTRNIPANGYVHVNLPDGMYTLVYSTGSERAVKQLVMQH